MGAMERAKGARIEREIVDLHRKMGVHAERTILSGATRYQGKNHDIDVYTFGTDEDALVAEIKGRRDGAGFTLLDKWLGDKNLLFLRKDRARPGVYMPWETYARLVEEIVRCRQELKRPLRAATLEKLVAAGDDADEKTQR